MRENYRNSIASIKKFPQFTTMNVIDGQAGLIICASLIFYSLTIDNILNIIVLLILAGVSIAVLTGENGILNRATEAKKTNEEKTAEEELKLGVSALSIDYRKNTTNSKTFKEFVTENSGENLKIAMGLETTNQDLIVENASAGVVSYKGQKYQVNDFGGVTEYVPGWEQNKTQVSKDGVTLTVGQAVKGYSVTVNSTAIGDGNWYVLGAKNGKLLITTKTNQGTVNLSGKDGYTGGIATLNAAAANYKNADLADGDARTLDVDDVNRVTGYKPDVAKYNAGTNYVEQWDNDVTYTLDNSKIYYKGTKYPIYAANELGTQSSGDSSFEYWNGSAWIPLGEGKNPTSATLKHTYYLYYPKTLTTNGSGDTAGIETTDPAYTLLFANTGYYPGDTGSYWLGSQFVRCREGNAFFGLRFVTGGLVNGYDLYYSYGITPSSTMGWRPVVSLASDVQVTSAGAISK